MNKSKTIKKALYKGKIIIFLMTLQSAGAIGIGEN